MDLCDHSRFIGKSLRQRLIKRGQRAAVLSGQGYQVAVSDLVWAAHQISSHDAIFAAQVVGHESVAWVSQKAPQDSESLLWFQAVSR